MESKTIKIEENKNLLLKLNRQRKRIEFPKSMTHRHDNQIYGNKRQRCSFVFLGQNKMKEKKKKNGGKKTEQLRKEID